MAHLEDRRKRGGSNQRASKPWRVRYRTGDGRERTRSFARKADAERFLHRVAHELETGTYIDPRAGRITLTEYAEEWRLAQVHRQSTAVTTESRLRRQILPAFGDRPMASIRPTEVQAWVKRLSDELAPATVEGCYRLLATIMRAAVADRLIPSSPCVNVRTPKPPRSPVEPLTVEVVAAIRDQLPEHVQAIVTVAAGAGLRQGETLGLTVDRVDFLRRTINVDRQLVTPQRGDLFLGPPKTQASVRTIPAPDVVLEALSAHLARWPVDHEWGLIFTNTEGRPWRRTRFAELWTAACRRAGIEARFHDLRHHHASLLIAAGCSVKVVQAQLGHASAAETLDTYSHLWPDDDERVRAAVDSALVRVSQVG